jgi:hypothetical protein
MWKEWIWPSIAMFLKAMSLIGILVCVWVASGQFHKDAYRRDADEVIHVRVRAECLRPDWVRTELDAQQFDVTMREMNVVAEKTQLINERLQDLLEKTKRVESMRNEYVLGKAAPAMGGIGGPAPSKKR